MPMPTGVEGRICIYGKDKLLESKENPYDITERLKKSYKED